MKLTSIHKLLNHQISIPVFLDEIEKEIFEYSAKQDIQGAIRPIKVCDEFSWILTEGEVAKLVQFYIDDEIPTVALEYICDCFELTDSIQYNENISEALFLLSNPEINGKNTKEKAIQIQRTLKKQEPCP